MKIPLRRPPIVLWPNYSPRRIASKYCRLTRRKKVSCRLQVVSGAMQMLGGYGMLKDFPLQQFMRDCRVHQVERDERRQCTSATKNE